jgi:hypothetical protein
MYYMFLAFRMHRKGSCRVCNQEPGEEVQEACEDLAGLLFKIMSNPHRNKT